MNVIHSSHEGPYLRYEKEPVQDAQGFEGPDESNTHEARILNVCGIIVADATRPLHPAWRSSSCIFGRVHKAYTTAANLVLHSQRISFKGATDSQRLAAVLRAMLPGQYWVLLQLVVLDAGIGRCLYCQVFSSWRSLSISLHMSSSALFAGWLCLGSTGVLRLSRWSCVIALRFAAACFATAFSIKTRS